METEDLEVRIGASSPTAIQPHAPAAHRTPEAGNGAATFAAPLTKRGRRGALRSGSARLSLYAVLAALSGVFVDLLKELPTVVTEIIVVTVFGTLIANDVSLRHGD